MKYIAFVIKGLEEICERELLSIGGLSVRDKSNKFIKFDYNGNPKKLQSLRTVDDVGIILSGGEVSSILTFGNEIINSLKDTFEVISKTRTLNNTFSITVSKYKNSEIAEEDLKASLSQQISSALSLEYTPLDHSNFDLRFNISGDSCLLTVKLFPYSLFRREYEHKTQLGSIRSTIAAAMLFNLSDNNTNLKVVDNFCGSGTFLCEALAYGHTVSGGDVDVDAVELTKSNLKKLSGSSATFPIEHHDAACTKWPSESFDIAVSNFPWGKQVKVDKISKLFDNTINEYSRILKKDAKIGFITLKPESLIKYIKKYFTVSDLVTLKVGYLGQNPTIVFARVTKL